MKNKLRITEFLGGEVGIEVNDHPIENVQSYIIERDAKGTMLTLKMRVDDVVWNKGLAKAVADEDNMDNYEVKLD